MKPTISNYIQPVKEAIPEFSNDSQAWDIAMETLKDTHGMLKGNRLDWMDTAKLKKLVRTAHLDIEPDTDAFGSSMSGLIDKAVADSITGRLMGDRHHVWSFE